jgi:hypothetical protein
MISQLLHNAMAKQLRLGWVQPGGFSHLSHATKLGTQNAQLGGASGQIFEHHRLLERLCKMQEGFCILLEVSTWQEFYAGMEYLMVEPPKGRNSRTWGQALD